MGEKVSKEQTGYSDLPHRKDSGVHEGDFSTDLRSTGFPAQSVKPKSMLVDHNRRSDSEQSRLSFGQGFTSSQRSVRVQMPAGDFDTISYSVDDKLTVGWLYSEYFRMFMGASADRKKASHIDLNDLLLVAENGDLNVDYVLADYSETLDVLSEGVRLVPFDRYQVKGSLTLKDVSIIKNIGIGGFSKVFLVRRNDTGRFYALKFVSKKDMKRNGKEEYAFNEKKLLSKLQHKFINRFLFSFQTPSYLCFGLEYCQGGCLYDLLKKQKSFSEDVVRVCIAQVALALAYLHNKGVIYRDLKVAYS